MGHQGIAINDMCEENKIEGLHVALKLWDIQIGGINLIAVSAFED